MSFWRKFPSAVWRHPGHLIWVAAAYVPLLGLMSVPLTGDQKVYLSQAMEMRETGHWLRPFLFGESSYLKPPFQYWMTLIGWKTLGFNLWGALLPSAIAMIATCWLIGELAQLLHERRLFVSSGLWFAASLATVTYATTAQMEIYLCFFYAASWWAGLKFLDGPRESRDFRLLYLAFALAGISALVKSPLYSVFWVLGYATYLVVSGEWELFRDRRLYQALGLGIVLGAAWFVWVLARDGDRFWSQYIQHETIGKDQGNNSTAWSLWGALLYFCFPFTLLLLAAIRVVWRGRRTGDILRFVVCWSWAPAIFFTLYPYRIKPYLYILVPALALLADWGYFRAGRTKLYRVASLMTALVMLLVFSAVALVLYRAELGPILVPIGFVLIGLQAVVCAWKDWMRGMAFAALAAVFFFRGAAVSLGETDIAGLRQAVAAKPTTLVAMIDENRNIWHEIGMLSVAIGKPMSRLYDLDEAARFLHGGGMLILTDNQARDSQRTIEAKLLGMGDLRELAEVPWMRWKVRAHFPYRELIKQGRAGIPDFDEQTKREFRIVWLANPGEDAPEVDED